MNCKNCGSNSFIFKRGNYYCEYCKSIYKDEKHPIEEPNEYGYKLPSKGNYKATYFCCEYSAMHCGYLVALIFRKDENNISQWDNEIGVAVPITANEKYKAISKKDVIDIPKDYEITFVVREVNEAYISLGRELKRLSNKGINIDLNSVKKVIKFRK